MHVPTSPSSSSNTHATSFRRYPDPETPPFPNPVSSTFVQRSQNPQNPSHATLNQVSTPATLNQTIHSLNTPFNTPVSSPRHSTPVTDCPSQPTPLQSNNHTQVPTFTQCPPGFPPRSSKLRWTWIEGDGPFVTNGQWRDTKCFSPETESDSITALMFNLDNLNTDRPEVLPNSTWNRWQIPESPDSMIETLVQRVDRGRFRFEVGNSSNGPNLVPNEAQSINPNSPQDAVAQNTGPTHKDYGPNTGEMIGPCHVSEQAYVQLHIVHASKHLVHTDLRDTKGKSLSITFVYGYPKESKREEVWMTLRSLKLSAHSNWLCIGDFNQVLNDEGKFSFHRGIVAGADSFKQLISDLNLCELIASG